MEPSSTPPVNAYAQLDSPFFRRLPPEIRQKIYEDILHSSGLTQHIYKSAIGDNAPISHTPCLTDPDAPDDREIRYFDTFEGAAADDDETIRAIRSRWRARQHTDWCNHWACEEAPAEPSGFLTPLLACRRMHDEFIPVLYSRLTFSFVNTPSLSRFVATAAAASLALVRSVHLVWYAPENANETDEQGSRRVSAWTAMWTRLSLACPRLTTLRLWVYGFLPRFPMPCPEYFAALDHLAGSGVSGAGSGPEQGRPRVMEQFTVQLVWTREFDSVVVDGVVVNPDDGEVVPDWLRGRPFRVTRVPALEKDPQAWSEMWARRHADDLDGEIMGARARTRGWGTRRTERETIRSE
jgi:hypothetical protein